MQDRAARLLHRRERDAAPALQPRSAHQRGNGRLGPFRDDRLHRRGAEHHRIANHIVHLVAFEHGLRERDGDVRLGRRIDARHELQAHVAAQHARDLRDPLVAAAVEDRHRVADAKPQHARQMLAFGAREKNRLVAGIE
jgi:hypothetical protein